MELPNVGKQCQNLKCKQLDFLPYTCKCEQAFCSNHYLEHVEICPLVKVHREVILREKMDPYRCSYPCCKETSLIPLVCCKCHQHFCVKHRHIMDCYEDDQQVRAEAIAKMMAPLEQFREAKAAVDKQVDTNISEARKKTKNYKLATQLQLMRIKNKATGLRTIPLGDRVYFNVSLPKRLHKEMTYPIFVSKFWSLGRTIDSASAECKVVNRNNQENSEKLRLFKTDTMELVSTDLSLSIETLVNQEAVLNGDNLRLDFWSEPAET